MGLQSLREKVLGGWRKYVTIPATAFALYKTIDTAMIPDDYSRGVAYGAETNVVPKEQNEYRNILLQYFNEVKTKGRDKMLIVARPRSFLKMYKQNETLQDIIPSTIVEQLSDGEVTNYELNAMVITMEGKIGLATKGPYGNEGFLKTITTMDAETIYNAFAEAKLPQVSLRK